MMFTHVLIYFMAFVGIWIGSGLAIGSVERLSRILRVSSFMVSFIVLGCFTSIGELSVGVNSILQNEPEIFVGNLIGATIVIFMLIIPLLAITGNKIKIQREFQGFNLPASLVVIGLPVVVSMDGVVGKIDAYITIVLFAILILIIQAKRSLLEKIRAITPRTSIKISKELLRIIFGLAIIFIASRFIVEQTHYFAELLGLSPFFISLLLIAIGTNIPELSIVVRSAFMNSNQVAFGDYVGSASFNTLLFGVLSLTYNNPIQLTNSYLTSLLFLILGLSLFFYFARTKNTITRMEGLILLSLYMLFLALEIYMHKGALFQ